MVVTVEDLENEDYISSGMFFTDLEEAAQFVEDMEDSDEYSSIAIGVRNDTDDKYLVMVKESSIPGARLNIQGISAKYLKSRTN